VQIKLDLDTLTTYGNSVLDQKGTLCAVEVSRLSGGYAEAEVYRVDLSFRLASGCTQTVPVALKNTRASEVGVMRALSQVPGAEALPLTIAYGQGVHTSDTGPGDWFVTPLYEGEHLTFEDEVPRLVIESLARVHAYYVSRVKQLDWLCHLDAGAFGQVFDGALKSLEAAEGRCPSTLLARAYEHLKPARRDPVILDALAELPVTLVHGDVHPWNIICLPDGRSVLIDWGNARIAPAMLDLANLVEMGSENWETYLSAWEGASGQAMEASVARLSYHWATVMINLQYLPYQVGQWPGNGDVPASALGMVERLQNAVAEMPHLL
jgi:aminoglycoside phosphotransferase (APT) family kinase protein